MSFRSGRFLSLNLKLIRALNPHPLPPWIVVENTPPNQRSEAESIPLECTILPGLAPSSELPAKVVGSYHHATALQRSLARVQTRFVLILDPDFYIVSPGWMESVLRWMDHHALAFFGAPWHPRWFVKYRYFPCVHCMFIDLSRVEKAGLDFQPEALGGGRLRALRKQLETKLPTALRPLYRITRRALLDFTQAERLQIGRTADTGTRICRRFGQHIGMESDIVLPVFREEIDALAPAVARSRLARKMEHLLPERFRYFPNPSSFTRQGFAERGFPSAREFGCEEFVWQDQPFGFHFRGTAQTAELRGRHEGALSALVEAFAQLGKGMVNTVPRHL